MNIMVTLLHKTILFLCIYCGFMSVLYIMDLCLRIALHVYFLFNKFIWIYKISIKLLVALVAKFFYILYVIRHNLPL